MTVEIKSAKEVRDLATGEFFHSYIGELGWRDAHAIMYHTAHKHVVLALLDGTVVEGTLDEAPGYFGDYGTKKAWLRQPGRKTRKSVLVRNILCWTGQKSPSLEESLSAYIVLNSGGATDEQIAEARQTAKML